MIKEQKSGCFLFLLCIVLYLLLSHLQMANTYRYVIPIWFNQVHFFCENQIFRIGLLGLNLTQYIDELWSQFNHEFSHFFQCTIKACFRLKRVRNGNLHWNEQFFKCQIEIHAIHQLNWLCGRQDNTYVQRSSSWIGNTFCGFNAMTRTKSSVRHLCCLQHQSHISTRTCLVCLEHMHRHVWYVLHES